MLIFPSFQTCQGEIKLTEPVHFYTRNYPVNTANMDMCSSWKASCMLEAMQETAATNSDLLGCGRQDLLKEHLAWVVLRMELYIDRYPVHSETATVMTYPKPPRHGMFPRYFILSDENGQVFARASSIWALLDLETRRSVPGASIGALIPETPELPPCLPKLPPVVSVLDAQPILEERVPVFTDLDANAHVNNVRYLDWCCNALGIDEMRRSEISHFVINFNREIVPGQKIRTDLRRICNTFTFSGYEGDEPHFHIFGELRQRS